MRHTILLFLVFFSSDLSVSPAAEKPLDFNRDVRPILSENCFQCHGFDEKARQADLRLDVAESALAERDGIPAIAPGKPDESELWRRVMSEDESEMMPPPDSHRVLKPEQKETLKLWIEQGAAYAKHWSFIPPVKAHVAASLRDASSSLEETRPRDWPRNEIDSFVLQRLKTEGLQPSAEADGRTLIRRVTLDLTGLPPSAEEVEAFIADESPDAYEKLVDRLLASPHFGERMALVWLDASRYADTNGFSIDGGRHMWLWRDWVINAFNTNMPYDQFLRDQLAGDLMPNRSEAQRIATGFQRNNMNTHEGGTIPQENLTNYNVDRVKTFGESVLGLTLGCAQCHDHKFDPITQRDYYQLFAYFNTLSDVGLDGDAGINSRPIYDAKTVLQTGEEQQLRRRIQRLQAKLDNPPAADVARWEDEQRRELDARGKDPQLHPVEVLDVSNPEVSSGFGVEPPNFVTISSPADLGAYDVKMRLPKLDRPITGLRILFHRNAKTSARGYGALPDSLERFTARPDKKKPKKPKVAKGTFVLTAFSASADTVPGDQINLNQLLEIARVTANSWHPSYRPEGIFDTRGEDGWSPDPAFDGVAHLTVTLAEPLDAAKTPFLTAQFNFGHGRSLVAARFEVQALTGADDGSPLPADIIEIIHSSTPTAPGATAGSSSSAPLAESQTTNSTNGSNQLASQGATGSASAARQGATGSASAARTADEQQALRAYYAKHAKATERDRIALANLEERLAVLTEKFPTMVMDVAEKPRDTFILNRGDYSQPTEKVTAGTPAVLPPLPSAPGSAGGSSTRLDLANWLTMREHPLTARVEVNRLWQICFGTGIVPTAADLGAQGEYPSHPELLDWLAVDFMENGWDVKRTLKKIVTSATYRQSSHVAASLRDANSSLGETRPRDLDPQNRLLARGPRFRLPAEFIRDSALKVSGLLVNRLGGPSVNPYTPGNLWREISHYGSTPATAQTFEQDHGEKLYRRSLYTYWKRTVPPPNMVAFDAPNREICTIARPTTTTPLQALVLLNDVQFVEAARAFAERTLKQPGDEQARLRWAFEECISRPPSETEFTVLTKALSRERARYAANEAAAQKFLSAGESPRDESIPAAEHAAWSQVAALLLNLSETVTRN